MTSLQTLLKSLVAKNNIHVCHLNTKDLVVIVFFIVLSSLHHHCSIIHPDHRGSQQWLPKKVCPIVVPAPVVPCPLSLIVAC
ncbi:hypothetical protein L208DRAFT_1391276 [Tricholoma matsutake]|nr:hypothetical protein L208DRAFT_1391276 [Tricholoma matsutake 945]